MAKQSHRPESKDNTSQSPSNPVTAEVLLQKNSKLLIYLVSALLLIAAGYFLYRSYIVLPKEEQASEAIWKAEQYFRRDSARLALNGDGAHPGFLRIMSNYKGTKAAKMAAFYAAACYMKLEDFDNAIKYLRDFSVDDKLIMVRATGLLGDAYAETGKKAEAAAQYRKAGTVFPEDHINSPEYLFRAGLLYQELGEQARAIEMFTRIKEKYPSSERGMSIDKYLGRLQTTP